MLQHFYCNADGSLKEQYPSYYQFRYFYRKYNKKETEYISRNGLSYYQRNQRPLTGDGVQAFAPTIGMGMLDATVCDIYLVNESGAIVGRPILTLCVDAYSGVICGYSLSWEGGIYSLRNLGLTDEIRKSVACDDAYFDSLMYAHYSVYVRTPDGNEMVGKIREQGTITSLADDLYKAGVSKGICLRILKNSSKKAKVTKYKNACKVIINNQMLDRMKYTDMVAEVEEKLAAKEENEEMLIDGVSENTSEEMQGNPEEELPNNTDLDVEQEETPDECASDISEDLQESASFHDAV